MYQYVNISSWKYTTFSGWIKEFEGAAAHSLTSVAWHAYSSVTLQHSVVAQEISTEKY